MHMGYPTVIRLDQFQYFCIKLDRPILEENPDPIEN